MCLLGERISILGSCATRKHGYYRCLRCAFDFTVRTGTVMERSKIPLHKWLGNYIHDYIFSIDNLRVVSYYQDMEININKFESGVNFVFAGGSERLFIEPIKSELAALEAWIEKVEAAFTGERLLINELPQSQYLSKLGRRKTRAASVATGHHEDVYGRGEFIRQWDDLVLRLLKVATVGGGDR